MFIINVIKETKKKMKLYNEIKGIGYFITLYRDFVQSIK